MNKYLERIAEFIFVIDGRVLIFLCFLCQQWKSWSNFKEETIFVVS